MTTTTPPQQPVPLSIDQTFDLALAQHQAGQLQEAEKLYLAVLQSNPRHPESNHNMGVLAMQDGQPAVGLPYFMAALDADPACAQYWLSAIDALFQADQLDAAQEVLTIALQQGLQGDEVDALVARIRGDAEHRTVFKEPQSFTSATSQGNTNAPNSQEIDTLVSLFNEERYAEAIILAEGLTERFPLHGFGWKVLGAALKQMGRSEDALEPMLKAAALSPNDADTHSNLGNTFKELGRLEEAEASCRRALQIRPDYAEAHNNLSITLQELGRLDEAEASCRQALQLMPDYAEVHNSLSIILHEQGRLDEAEASCRRALQIMPDYAEAHNNLGGILHELGRLEEAEASCLRALHIKPIFAQAHNNLGFALQAQGRLDKAEISYRLSLEIKPDCTDAHNNLGLTLQELGRLDEAEAVFRLALKINPEYAETYNNLGSAMLSRGQVDAAIVHFRKALEIKPDYVMAHSNLIFTQVLMTNENASSLHEERKRWDAKHAAHLRQQLPHTNSPISERRMRIGYVSADFGKSSAACAFGGMLTRYDRSQFEVIAYSNSKKIGDDITELFKQSVTVWRNIVGLSDDTVANMVREDQIDILIDLSSHMAGNRLLVFARKPAPIQISAWGNASGTGMQAMDVLFSDPVMTPPEDRQYFVEKVIYLPNAIGSFFIDPLPEVNNLPALKEGTVTFGSLNRLVKISEDAYSSWAEILLAIPGSRFFLKTAELDDASTRERVVGYFSKVGIAEDRIIMQGKTSWYDHMQAYHQIDIALDPFPHGGGVTALEGLMMGVPVITLRWPTLAGRLSASIMTTLGLTDWIAKNRQEYIELAIQKATDLQSLAVLRQQLRGIFNSSVIGDQTAYARAVEQEYRKLWQEWCDACLK